MDSTSAAGRTPPQVAGYRVEELVGLRRLRRGLAGEGCRHWAGCGAQGAAPRRATHRARPAAARGGCPRRPELAAHRAAAHGRHHRAGLGAGARVPGRRQPGGTAAHPAEACARRGGHHRGATGGRARRGARAGVVHGDISPANLLFAVDGRPVLSDLGVSRLAGRAGADAVTAAYADPLRARRGAADTGVRRLCTGGGLLPGTDRPSALPRRRRRVGACRRRLAASLVARAGSRHAGCPGSGGRGRARASTPRSA